MQFPRIDQSLTEQKVFCLMPYMTKIATKNIHKEFSNNQITNMVGGPDWPKRLLDVFPAQLVL